MPNKAGRFTRKERTFITVMARTNDATYAATKAGYAVPEVNGSLIAAKPAIAGATRDEVQRYLRDEAPALAVGVIAELTGPKTGERTRLAAGLALAKLSGIGVNEGDSSKELYEMSGPELEAERRKAKRRADAYDSALADRARLIIEHEAQEQPKGVFG